METLREAYASAKKNNGAPVIDGVKFEAIEAQGAEPFLEQIQNELIDRTYVPLRARGGRYRRTGARKSGWVRFPLSATEWCKARSSSFWSRFPKRTSSLGRTVIVPNALRMKRCIA
jgi:hypothetical protein